MSYSLNDVDFTRLKGCWTSVSPHKNIIIITRRISREFKGPIKYAADIFNLNILCKEVKAVNPVFARSIMSKASGLSISDSVWKENKDPVAVYRGTFVIEGYNDFILECFYNYGEMKYVIRHRKYSGKNKMHPAHNTRYETSQAAVHALCLATKHLNED